MNGPDNWSMLGIQLDRLQVVGNNDMPFYLSVDPLIVFRGMEMVLDGVHDAMKDFDCFNDVT